MIDKNRIAELRSEVGEENFGEILELFIAEMDEAVEELETDHHLSKLESRLHFIKGSALNLGLTTMTTLCHKGERAAANAQYDQIDIPLIVETYRQTKTELLDYTSAGFV